MWLPLPPARIVRAFTAALDQAGQIKTGRTGRGRWVTPPPPPPPGAARGIVTVGPLVWVLTGVSFCMFCSMGGVADGVGGREAGRHAARTARRERLVCLVCWPTPGVCPSLWARSLRVPVRSHSGRGGGGVGRFSQPPPLPPRYSPVLCAVRGRWYRSQGSSYLRCECGRGSPAPGVPSGQRWGSQRTPAGTDDGRKSES